MTATRRMDPPGLARCAPASIIIPPAAVDGKRWVRPERAWYRWARGDGGWIHEEQRRDGGGRSDRAAGRGGGDPPVPGAGPGARQPAAPPVPAAGSLAPGAPGVARSAPADVAR